MSLPLPKVVSDVEPGGRLFTNMNAVSKAGLENRRQQIENTYAPYQQYYNALKTSQEAKWLPYQYANQALASPTIWMTPEGRNAAQNIISSLPGITPKGGSNDFNAPNPNQQQSSNPLNWLRSLFGGGNNNSMQPPPNGGPPMGQDQFGQAPQRGTPAYNNWVNGSNGNNGSPQSPIPAIAAAQQNSSGLNTNPNPIQTQSDMAGAQTSAIQGQVGNQTAEQKTINERINNQSSGAINALKALKGWKKNYDASTYKGQYLGSGKTSGIGSIPNAPGHNNASEQKAKNYADQYLQIMTQMGDLPGAMTDYGREILSDAKGLDLSLDKEAANDLYESRAAGLERLSNSRKFAHDFFKNNPAASQEDLIEMMNNYNRYAPAYDSENEKPIPENEEKYKDFTSRKAYESYQRDSEYNPYKNKRKESAPKESSDNKPKLSDFLPNESDEDYQARRTLKNHGHEEEKIMDGKEYHKINGRWYPYNKESK